MLTDHAALPQFTCTHHWRDGDVVMWDNIATTHRATEYDDLTYIRDTRRITVLKRKMAD